jgi:hypothetical protein
LPEKTNRMLFLGFRAFSDGALELAETGSMGLAQGCGSMDRQGFIGLKAWLHLSSQTVYSHKDMNAIDGSFIGLCDFRFDFTGVCVRMPPHYPNERDDAGKPVVVCCAAGCGGASCLLCGRCRRKLQDKSV